MTRSGWSSSVASGLAAALLAATTAGAATVLERTVEITIQPDGRVREHESFQVRLDEARDLDTWGSHSLSLDENRTLASAEAYVLRPDGTRSKVGRKDRDSVDLWGGGVLHTSRRLHVLDFSGLRVGSMLVVDSIVDERPYFPAGQVVLALDDPTERLRVAIAGGGAGWRWRLDGPAQGIEVEETPGGIVLTARGLVRPSLPPLAPGGAVAAPVLRYAWGETRTWTGVGRWFAELVRAVPRAAPAVRAAARSLVGDRAEPRARLEALLGFLRRQVRYVAVEVGVGGYRPSAPEEVLTRKWGDCKDKALLLVDLLAEAGIEAHPALILAAPERRIDRDFPAPSGFNHMIVAVPAVAVGAGDDDPTAGGYLFVDPTQSRGAVRWLSPFTQGQDALVVTAGGGELVATPVLPRLERRSLLVNLSVTGNGDAAGGAGLEITGTGAAALLDLAATAPPERMEEAVRTTFSQLLPGVTVGRVTWSEREGDVPAVAMAAAVVLPALRQGAGPRFSFQLPGMTATPDPVLIADRRVPMTLAPVAIDATWHLGLPAGCRLPEGDRQDVDTGPAAFAQRVVAGDDGRITVERRAELRRRWVEPDEFPALREAALAEHRAQRRRLRIDCEPAAAPAAP